MGWKSRGGWQMGTCFKTCKCAGCKRAKADKKADRKKKK